MKENVNIANISQLIVDFFFNLYYNKYSKWKGKFIMFETLEELQKKYPIGSAYHITWREIKAWCPNINDILIFKNKHPNARNFMICDNDFITAEEKHEDKVEGYIFDGEYWYPAVQTWDGRQAIDEEECNI